MPELLNRLDVWLAIFTLGALAWFELRLGRFVGPIVRGAMSIAEPAVKEVKRRSSRQLPTAVRLKPRPIRGDGGRFDGSLPAVPVVPEMKTRSDDRSALERGVPDGNDVSIGTILPEEAALIGLRLGRGLSRSDVVKSLPGYSARKYREYMEKVQKVEFALAELEPVEETPA